MDAINNEGWLIDIINIGSYVVAGIIIGFAIVLWDLMRLHFNI
jgi:hypothetical protein